jgi:hypothetical protein
VHIQLSQLRAMPGAGDLEDGWIRARLGEDGYLAGPGAQAAACDTKTVPIVNGAMNPDIIDQIIGVARAAAETGSTETHPQAPVPGAASAETAAANTASRNGASGGIGASAETAAAPPGAASEARSALRYAIARLAIDLVSGPAGIAATLRQGLLDKPWNAPSLPLDIGRSRTIPGHIRRAVQVRDHHCAWPRCDRPAAQCDVHHLRQQADGGETSLANCVLLCQLCRRRHNRHYAELRVMPMPGFPALVAGVGVLWGSA